MSRSSPSPISNSYRHNYYYAWRYVYLFTLHLLKSRLIRDWILCLSYIENWARRSSKKKKVEDLYPNVLIVTNVDTHMTLVRLYMHDFLVIINLYYSYCSSSKRWNFFTTNYSYTNGQINHINWVKLWWVFTISSSETTIFQHSSYCSTK